MISMVVDKQEEWDENLPFIAMVYRSTSQWSAGFTPNFMMYVRELSMPVGVILSLPPGEQYTEGQYAQKLQKQLVFAYEMAWVALKRTAEKQTRLYNQSTFVESMTAGDVVWYAIKLPRKGVTPKFQPKWKGPCLITKMHNKVLAQIQLSSVSVTVHTDLLKLCHSKNLPGW